MCCVASGPSLTREDCQTIEKAGIETIAVNNSWEIAPFCKSVYAGDYEWWKQHKDKINIPAERWTCSQKAAKAFGLNLHRQSGGFNSGMRAIELAIKKGAKTVILLGYDGSTRNGIHWHGPHEKLRNPSELKVAKWKKQFGAVAKQAKEGNVRVVNCSRDTVITCFERSALEDVL